jgi:hypothetical protein
VDTTVARVLCALANIRKMPVFHVYAWNGDSCELKLADIAPSKSKYEDFILNLARLSDVSPALLMSGEAGTSVVGNVGVVSSSREDPQLAKGQILVVTNQEQNTFTLAVFDKEHEDAAHALAAGLKAAHAGGTNAVGELSRAAEEARQAIALEATLTRSAIVMCCRGWRKLLA